MDDAKTRSAALAIKKSGAKEAKEEDLNSIVPEEVSFVELEPVVPVGMISSADVPESKGRHRSKTAGKKSKSTKKGKS